MAALAADAPEITSAAAAMSSGQRHLGAGVVVGSNVFNLAALLGLGALVAGWIGLPRAHDEVAALPPDERAALPPLVPPARVVRAVTDLLAHGRAGEVVEVR